MRDAAVIDMGSNSVRLLLVQAGRTEQFLETTRLGKGVEARRLQKEPMERTVQAVERFCALARSRGIGRVYAFATSAVRDAENRGELLALLRERCGLAVDVLSGEVKRAPERWQRLGLEWLYRLLKEPRRIGRMMKLPQFVVEAARQRARGRRDGKQG